VPHSHEASAWSTSGVAPYNVLIVEGDMEICGMLCFCLEKEGYQVFSAATEIECVEAADRHPLSAVVLNMDLSALNSIALIERLRSKTQAHIIAISSRNDEANKVRALDTGANDYLVRPVSMVELAARLRVAQRFAPASVFKAGALTMDFCSRTVTVAGQKVKLTATEFSLLSMFARNAGKVLTHAEILKAIWGPRMVKRLEYLRVYLKSLRGKIESNPDAPQLLLTERLIGYRLAVPVN
jgi:two-component system KDP operon response regulator KdpE